MKYLILIITFFSTQVYAGWYMPVGKDGAATSYRSKATCEQKESAECFDVQGKNPEYHEAKSVEVDDETKPIYKEKYNEVACADAGDCSLKSSKEPSTYCQDGDEIMFKENSVMPGWQYYCTKLLGYGKKIERSYVLNQGLKDAYDQKTAQAKTKAEALAQVRDAKAFGGLIMDEVHLLNASKDLSTAQVRDFLEAFKGIERMLSAGALETARDEIALITPSEVVSETEKQDIINKINSYLNK